MGKFTMKQKVSTYILLAFGLALSGVASAQTAKQPNIAVITGDDIGRWNIGDHRDCVEVDGLRLRLSADLIRFSPTRPGA